jgi:hypothetical protein
MSRIHNTAEKLIFRPGLSAEKSPFQPPYFLLEIGFRPVVTLALAVNRFTVYQHLIYVFPEMTLRVLVPNSFIHVSVSNLYIPRSGLPIWQQQNRQADPGNI